MYHFRTVQVLFVSPFPQARVKRDTVEVPRLLHRCGVNPGGTISYTWEEVGFVTAVITSSKALPCALALPTRRIPPR